MSLRNNPLGKYLLESRDELAKVNWPSRKQVVNHTLVVIAISVVVGAYFGVLDYVLNKILEGLIQIAN